MDTPDIQQCLEKRADTPFSRQEIFSTRPLKERCIIYELLAL
jgi:hypothetical protein